MTEHPALQDAEPLHALQSFEGTHPTKRGQHRRDVLHGIMAAESMEKGAMQREDIRTLPSAGMLSGEEAKQKGERPPAPADKETKKPRDTIQGGARSVTKQVASRNAPGFGKGDLPASMDAQTEVRLRREIANFERWIRATGEVQKVDDKATDKENLKQIIRARLDAYLKSKGM